MAMRAVLMIETLTAELGQLRSHIDAQRGNQHTWPTTDEELVADFKGSR